ncbi:hypothetical protein GCM10027162_21590 [Streptomyces incanus]
MPRSSPARGHPDGRRADTGCRHVDLDVVLAPAKGETGPDTAVVAGCEARSRPFSPPLAVGTFS